MVQSQGRRPGAGLGTGRVRLRRSRLGRNQIAAKLESVFFSYYRYDPSAEPFQPVTQSVIGR